MNGARGHHTEKYAYDTSNNLIEVCHQRDGNHFTQHTRIDPDSNRGVRWKEGDLAPDFDTLFDPNTRSGLQEATRKTLEYITHAQKGMADYKEMGTTDNQFLSRQSRAASRKTKKAA